MGDAAFLSGIDRALFLFVNRALQNPVFDYVMPALSDKWLGFLALTVVVPWLVVRYGRRAWPAITLAVLAVVLSDLVAGLIKHAVQRARPCHVVTDVRLLAGCTRSFALPSNHASNMFALAAVVWSVLPAWRWGILLLAGGVAYSRVYLGVHYPGDVLAGALCGLALGWGLIAVAKRVVPASWAPKARLVRDAAAPDACGRPHG